MKKILLGIFAFILLIFVALHFIDWSHYKKPVIDTIKEHTGFDLDLRGPVRLGLFPTPHFSAIDVAVKNKEGGKSPNLLELESISLKVPISSLMHGQVEVSQVELIEPKIYMETFQDGSHNWDVKKEKEDTSASKQASESSEFKLSLQNVTIVGGYVSFQDLQTQSSYEIKNINLEGSLDSLSGPYAIKGNVEIDDYLLSGQIQTTGLPSNDKPSVLNAIISAAKGKDTFGTLNINGNLLGKKFSGDIKSDDLKIPFSIDISNKKMDLKKGVKVSAHVEAESKNINISNLVMNFDKMDLTGSLVYKNPEIECKLTLQEAGSKIDLSAKGKSDEKSLWAGSVVLQSEKPHAFLAWAGLENSPYLRGAFNISTQLNAQAKTYTLSSLKFKVGLFEGEGSTTIKLDKNIPYIQSNVSFKKLDINAILGNPKQKEGPAKDLNKPVNAGASRWSQEKWNFDFLKKVNTDFTFHVSEILYDEYHLEQVQGTLHLQDGNLQLKSFQGKGYGGTLSGTTSVQQGKSPSFGVNFSIQEINLGSLPKITQTPLKKATLNAKMNVTTSGNSPFEAVQALSGDMHLILSHGVIEAFDVKKFVNDIKHVKNIGDIDGLMKTLNTKALSSFTHLKADFALQNGKANSQNIEFLSDDVLVNGKGVFDLFKWIMQMNAQIKVKELGNLPPLSMKIEGSLDSPSYSVDKDVVARILLQEATHRLLGKATEGIGGKAGEILRGVLGKGKEKPSPQQSPQEKPKKKDEPSLQPEKILKGLFGA